MMINNSEAKNEKKTAVVWVVVVAKPGQERRAQRELKQQGFETYLPMKLSQNRKKELVAAPFFPRYLFARVSLHMQDWKKIWSTYGVQGLLAGSADRPMGVSDLVVERIQAEEEGGFIKMGLDTDVPELKRGQRVRVEGELGIEGMFLEMVDDRRAALLTSLFRGDSRLTVDLRKLKAAGAD